MTKAGEIAKQMIENAKANLSKPYPVVCLSKTDWAQIIGICVEAHKKGATDKEDVRWKAVELLCNELGMDVEEYIG